MYMEPLELRKQREDTGKYDMKIDRLIGIITLLLRQEKVTALELAERFEVSRRTISRDIDAICRAGIPLVTAQGYGGGISIAGGYKIDKSLFTKEEWQAVFDGLKSIDSVSRISHWQKLMEKLAIDSDRAVCAENIICIDLASYYQDSLTPKIETIRHAAASQNLISFRYFYARGEEVRTVEPYLLLFRWSSWYLYAFCLKRQGYRLFKLNRLWELKELDQTFALRNLDTEKLNLEGYFEQGTMHLKAVFHPAVKYRLVEEYGIQCMTECQDGHLLFEWDFAGYENMKTWILSFGSMAEVLEPQELRQDIRKEAEKILQRK